MKKLILSTLVVVASLNLLAEYPVVYRQKLVVKYRGDSRTHVSVDLQSNSTSYYYENSVIKVCAEELSQEGMFDAVLYSANGSQFLKIEDTTLFQDFESNPSLSEKFFIDSTDKVSKSTGKLTVGEMYLIEYPDYEQKCYVYGVFKITNGRYGINSLDADFFEMFYTLRYISFSQSLRYNINDDPTVTKKPTTSAKNLNASEPTTLKTFNLLGQEVLTLELNKLYVQLLSDGSTRKILVR